MPERVEEDRRTAPLLVRPGVPEVEEVEDVGVLRSEPVYICGGYWAFWWAYCACWGGGYWAFMVVVVGEGAMGKMPEEVVRVREWPDWASKGRGERVERPGFVMGFLRTGSGCEEGAMVAIVIVLRLAWLSERVKHRR